MDPVDLEAQIDRIIEVADTLRLKSNHTPFNDDLEDLADVLQDVAEVLIRGFE